MSADSINNPVFKLEWIKHHKISCWRIFKNRVLQFLGFGQRFYFGCDHAAPDGDMTVWVMKDKEGIVILDVKRHG